VKRLHDRKIDDAVYYEKIWDPDMNQRPFYDAVRHRALASKVRCGDIVVDIGAGVYGTVQYILEHESKRLEIFPICYDQSYTARNVVLKKFPYILYLLGGLPETYLPTANFDNVIAGEIIEHMEDPEKLAYELARLCRSSGWISLSTVDTTCENAIAHGEYPEHIFEFEPKELIRMFEPFGRVQYGLVGDYHVLHCHRK
jgi:2-polyprenyl-3-methyl-5-hydroxy-6-metoxy-1,4-benzoquinol methylase